jgi:hypothetical protein
MSTPPHRPQPPKPHRATWVDKQHRYWRIELVAGRWQLSLYSPATETWTRIGSYPSKTAAIEAAYEQNERS